MATSSSSLTLAYRAEAANRAAKVAALVALYYRAKVDLEDPDSIVKWIDLMVPKILGEHRISAALAARYGDAIRRIEVPDITDGYRYAPWPTAVREQIATSLSVVGVRDYEKKLTVIREANLEPAREKVMLERAKAESAGAVAASVVRHVQNGGRATIDHGALNDKTALGWVRVTKAKPCFFCAMLASRGLEYGVYKRDSFDRSDARFVGDGDAKVHDGCHCSLKPVYLENDPILEQNKAFEDMWYEFSGDGDADPLTNFRRHYEGRPITKSA